MATTHVMYDGKRLIPAPLMSYNRVFNLNGNGEIIGTKYAITLVGTLVAFKGSPNSSGQFWTLGGYPSDETILANSRLKSIQNKQEAILELFSKDNGGKLFEIQSADASAPVKFYPRILDVNFPEGTWYDRCEYTVQMESDTLVLDLNPDDDTFSSYLESMSENWSIQPNEEQQTVTYTHTVSAKGKTGFTTEGSGYVAYTQAREWVRSRKDFNSAYLTNAITPGLPTTPYDLIQTEEANPSEGAYSLTSIWRTSDNPYIHTYSINHTETIQDSLKRVTINGTVEGLSNQSGLKPYYDTPGGKFSKASGAFYGTILGQLPSLIVQYTNIGYLNSTPNSYTIVSSPKAGIITYDYSYDNRPPNIMDNARFENITVTDNYRANVFASIPVLGRSAGPILQDIRTVTETSRILTVEVGFIPPTGRITSSAQLPSRPDYTSVTGIFAPVANKVFIAQNQETWEPLAGRGSRIITWVYQ